MPTAYITCPRSDADELATALLADRLAACVNIVDRQPYDVPCIERFEDDPIDPFRAWRDRSVEE
ncbi:divalent cation tolerance protein CutA [Halocatena pleomorpha]|uniref:Divalent cation tolerance protein CutA n=1 Tax=Halocatena pleomorpha TaxID=1785090 RepID=A0A3P3R403_9EURY|nr:divalent cation tolerance protein CutA [Halocatena pleomorpha]RRJ28206.1 divalent cation tolerance protein CutA [Halocatena pleomorpha]